MNLSPNKTKQSFTRLLLAIAMFILMINTSCRDEYIYDDPDSEPAWLGSSIYDFLVEEGDYTTFVKLIEDLNYKEVLSKTGSKTLFVANDSAFTEFYKSNEWGVASYDELGLAQKKMLLKFAMIDNAYLIETLANYNAGSLHENMAMRRSTSSSVLDTIFTLTGDDIPDNDWFDYFDRQKYRIVNSDNAKPMVYFLENTLNNLGITSSDFTFITGKTRQSNDAHVFDIKVVERDITCKNGYVHRLESVLVPPSNMAEYLLTDASTSVFSDFIERYAFPYVDSDITDDYRDLYPESNDTIWVKYYQSNITLSIPGKAAVPLLYNPGNNALTDNNPLQSDLAAIFAPSDAAFNEFFTNSVGKELIKVYGTVDDIPDDKIKPLLDRHMRRSFTASVPSRFSEMVDESSYALPVDEADIEDTYIGVNGVVYVTNKVYPPIEYASIYAPVLISKESQVFNWAVEQNKYEPYINSLENTFTFFVPTDEFFNTYIDPIAYHKEIPAALKFWYDKKSSNVYASVFAYDKSTNTIGDSLDVIKDKSFVADRLLDLLDLHLVIGSVDASKEYYFSKGGNVIKVNDKNGVLQLAAGGDVTLNQSASIIETYEQVNGTTYYIDKPLQAPINSVYSILSNTPAFSAFFELASGFPDNNIFLKSYDASGSSPQGDNAADFNISFFNTFNYTVYVPTNEAIDNAIADGTIHPWSEINHLDTVNGGASKPLARQYAAELERFMRYHFQDNSVYVGMTDKTGRYQTATIHDADTITPLGTYKNKYLKLDLDINDNSMSIITESGSNVNVKIDGGLYNIMTRDYIFNNSPEYFNQIDGSSLGEDFDESRVVTSSTAVLHQIDNVLKFE